MRNKILRSIHDLEEKERPKVRQQKILSGDLIFIKTPHIT